MLTKIVDICFPFLLGTSGGFLVVYGYFSASEGQTVEGMILILAGLLSVLFSTKGEL